MDGKNSLYGINKNDNTSRIMFSVICLLVVLIVALCIYLFAFKLNGGNTGGDKSEPTVSNSESSEESRDVTEEISDISDEDSVIPVDNSEDVSEDNSQETSETSETSTDEITEHGWVINHLGYTYLYYGMGLEQFTYSTNTLEKYVASVNQLSTLKGNANFYHLLIPTRCEFIEFSQEIKKEFYIANQRQFMTKVFDNTDKDIKNIDVYDVFKKRYNDGDYIYFNTDPNYTHLAAYTAYVEFCKSAGITSISDTFYSITSVPGNFYGKFYTATGAKMLYDNSDTILYYDIDVDYKSSISIYKSQGVIKKDGVVFFDVPSYGYYCFLSDEAAKIEITTKVNSGKSILVIGDSSASPFVTFLVPHYDKITFINSTLASDSILDLLTSGQYKDILVINYNTTASRTIYDNLNKLAGVAN